jgi:hypothetical protein
VLGAKKGRVVCFPVSDEGSDDIQQHFDYSIWNTNMEDSRMAEDECESRREREFVDLTCRAMRMLNLEFMKKSNKAWQNPC